MILFLSDVVAEIGVFEVFGGEIQKKMKKVKKIKKKPLYFALQVELYS